MTAVATGVAMQRETMTHELMSEALPLLSAHWAEVAHYQDIPLNVDVGMYLAAEAAGNVRCYTVRKSVTVCVPALEFCDTDSQMLVGYAVYFVRSNPHYKQSIQASQDVLFIHPDSRGIGREFLEWTHDELRREGVQACYQHVKVAHNFGPLLKRMGYECVDLIFAKRLDRPHGDALRADAAAFQAMIDRGAT